MENELKESPLELLWTKEIKEDISKVAFADGNVVVGTKEGLIKCFGVEGELKWEHNIKDDIIYLEMKNKTIATCSKHKVYFLDAKNGKIKWDKNIDPKESILGCWLSEKYVLIEVQREYKEDLKYPLWYLSLFDKKGNLKWKREYNIGGVIGGFSDEYISRALGESMELIDTEKGNKKWEFVPDPKIRGNCFDDMWYSYIFDKKYVGVCADDGVYVLDVNGNLVMKCDKFTWGGAGSSNKLKEYIAVSSENELALFNIKEKKEMWCWRIYTSKSHEDLECDIDDEFIWDKSELNIKKMDDTHYIGEYNRDGFIIKMLWIIDPESWSVRSGLFDPLILNNYVFVGRDENDLYVFNIDGEFIWNQRFHKGNGSAHLHCFDNNLLLHLDVPIVRSEKQIENIHSRYFGDHSFHYLYLFKLK